MHKPETKAEPALPLCGVGWHSLRIVILLGALFLLTACSSCAKRCPACEPDVVTVQQEPTPPPVMLTQPCRPLPAPSKGSVPVDGMVRIALKWAEMYAECRDRHGRLVEAVK